MATQNQSMSEIIDQFVELKIPVISYKHECPRCHKQHNKEKFTTFNQFRDPQTEYFCSDKCKKGK